MKRHQQNNVNPHFPQNCFCKIRQDLAPRKKQVAGLHRASPSATLHKVYESLLVYELNRHFVKLENISVETRTYLWFTVCIALFCILIETQGVFMKTVLGCIRRADEQFTMIEEGDHVAVGLSGGKDSLLLAYALGLYRKFCRRKFTLEAITLGLGFEPFDADSLARFCESIDVPFTYKPTDIKHVVFDVRKEQNPCALCAKLRRGALNKLAHDHGCNKVALGHHREDVLETLLMSMFFEARMHVFAPVTYLTRSDVTVIRPMIFLPERHVINVKNRLDLPVVHNPCPANGYTKRQDMKELLKSFNSLVPDRDAANRLMVALSNIDQYQLWDKIDRKPKIEIDESVK